jgi:hypothetical protein
MRDTVVRDCKLEATAILSQRIIDTGKRENRLVADSEAMFRWSP